MAADGRAWTDTELEQVMGTLLRVGVLLAASVVLLGGVVYLTRHGGDPAEHGTFTLEKQEYRSPVEIVEASASFQGRAIIQLGVLLLIATPVARVVFSAYAFFRQRDWVYVVVTLIVLAVLSYSLFSGYVESSVSPS